MRNAGSKQALVFPESAETEPALKQPPGLQFDRFAPACDRGKTLFLHMSSIHAYVRIVCRHAESLEFFSRFMGNKIFLATDVYSVVKRVESIIYIYDKATARKTVQKLYDISYTPSRGRFCILDSTEYFLL